MAIMVTDSMQEGYDNVCPICNGRKWIEVDLADGYKWVRRCRCFERDIIEERLRKSGLYRAICENTFESFIAAEPWQQIMKDKAEKYKAAVISTGDNIPWLFIGGMTGCGKTHICTAVIGDLIKTGFDPKYMQWVQDSREIKKDMIGDHVSAAIEPFKTARILYIDDLFKGNRNPTDSDIRICFEIFNYRYNNDLPTIISSEQYLDSELVNVDEATFSRVIEKTGAEFMISVDRQRERNHRIKDVIRV